MLILGGGVFGYWLYRQNSPAPMWVELPINPESSDEQRNEAMTKLQANLKNKELLLKVSKDMGLAKVWGMASDTEAEAELARRIFVKLGETAAPMGRIPALHVGVTGKKKERKLSGDIAVRLMEDVMKILNIMPPPSR